MALESLGGMFLDRKGGEDEESSFMESAVRKTGRRICGCDRAGFVCGHGACPAMRVLPVFIQKQQLDTFATELVREAEVSGRVGAETSRRAAVLSEKNRASSGHFISSHGRIQLNEEVTVILTMDTNIGLFGEFASFRLRFAHRQLENQKFTGNEVEGLRKRMKEILRDRRASSFPMTIGIVLFADYSDVGD